MDSSVPKPYVCVTGATGYIASFIVRDLLAHGYRVRGTVRSLAAKEKIAPLLALPNAGLHLDLVEADLLLPETLAAALSGTSALIHTATPVLIAPDSSKLFATVAEWEEKQIRPAVEGTRVLLHAAVAEGVSKVLLTSSIAAMAMKASQPEVLDETCWSNEEFGRSILLEHGSMAYSLAKTVQERVAWEIARENDLNLVVINPSVVCGPSLSQRQSVSLDFLLFLAKGEGWVFSPVPSKKGKIPDGFASLVDVRDVSMAHVLALEKAEAKGRYLLLSQSVHLEDITRVMREAERAFARLPETPIDSVDGKRHAVGQKFNNDKAVGLGLKMIRWQDAISESAKALVASKRI